MLGAGTHIRVVAERPRGPCRTLRVYSHVTATVQTETAAVMDRILGCLSGTGGVNVVVNGTMLAIAPRRNGVIADEYLSRPRGSNPEPVVYKTTALPLS